jgi:hypothetical protein
MWKAVTMIYRELCGDAGLPDMWGWRKTRSGRKAYWEQSKFFYALQGLEEGRKYRQQFDVEDAY